MDEAAGQVTAPFDDIDEVDEILMQAVCPPAVQRFRSVAQGISWADLSEQYDALFNPECPDREAQLMGIPPPPDDWITPPKPFRARTMQAVPVDVETGNRFNALQAPDARGSCSPACARPLAPPTSPSTSRGVEPHPQKPSPHTSSKSPASAV